MYDFKKIEKKWQNYWKEKETFKAVTGGDKEKYYILVEFPYPSGAGLHVGHVRSYTALDSVARMKRMKGYKFIGYVKSTKYNQIDKIYYNPWRDKFKC